MPTRLQKIHQEATGERLEVIEFARKLRQDATDAESLLWACLRDRRVHHRKFRRQHPVGSYVLDFYCAELNLAIELDGGQHNSAEGKARDLVREAFLRTQGIQTLRFTNHEMLREAEAVLNMIWNVTKPADSRPLSSVSDAAPAESSPPCTASAENKSPQPPQLSQARRSSSPRSPQ